MIETIKIGSSGEAVKTLQRLIGVNDDGVFGPNTEKAVKRLQAENGLLADGVVGTKTWSVLLKDEIDFVDGHINVNIVRAVNRPIRYIAIHYTAGVKSTAGSAIATRSVFLNRKASADFIVDDEDIVQINPDIKNYYCWSVGDKKNVYTGGGRLYGKATNKNTVSIEICSNLKRGTSAAMANHAGWSFTEKSLNNALRLIWYLMKKYNIPKERVVRHYDISGKLCPGIIGWNDSIVYTIDGRITSQKNDSSAWIEFWNKI